MKNKIVINNKQYELKAFAYRDKSIGLIAESKENNDLVLTLSVPDIKVKPEIGEIVIKDHNQNKGFIDQLIHNGVLENIKIARRLGHGVCYISYIEKKWRKKLEIYGSF